MPEKILDYLEKSQWTQLQFQLMADRKYILTGARDLRIV